MTAPTPPPPFLVIKEINKYLVDMILINHFRSGAYIKLV
jgi:hypothetical protein